MTKELITKLKELEDDLRIAQKYSQIFYEEILGEYAINIWALKFANDDYPYLQAIEIQERYSDLGRMLPMITEEEFDEYVLLGDQLAVLLKVFEVKG